MHISQRLASGLTIRQNFRQSARFVMFETGDDNWKYATHGGTAFIVTVGGQAYGLTCRHCMGDFHWSEIALSDEREGRLIAGINSVLYPSNPEGDAIDSDVLDIGVIQFSDDVGIEFFNDASYIIDDGTIVTSNLRDRLQIYGALKDQSIITEDTIAPIFGDLDLVDDGPTGDSAVRRASGPFNNPALTSMTGLSGSPVFNASQGKLCGMVVRGGLDNGTLRISYIDIADIMQLLRAIADGTMAARYNKTIARPG